MNKPRKLNKYQIFFGKYRRKGFTPSAISILWKKEKEKHKPKVVKSKVVRPRKVVRPKVVKVIRSRKVIKVVKPRKVIKVVRPKVIKVVRPKVVRPKVVRPKVVRPKVVRPKVVRPKVVRPKVVRSKVVRSKVVRPKSVKIILDNKINYLINQTLPHISNNHQMKIFHNIKKKIKNVKNKFQNEKQLNTFITQQIIIIFRNISNYGKLGKYYGNKGVKTVVKPVVKKSYKINNEKYFNILLRAAGIYCN